MKNLLEDINSGLELVRERIHELGDRLIEAIQTERGGKTERSARAAEKLVSCSLHVEFN